MITTTIDRPSTVAARSTSVAAGGHVLREPMKEDGYAIHQLIEQCPPLDLNSVYTYLLLSEHFSGTCVVAQSAQGLDGFVSAYFHPERPDVLFIWQVAVHSRARGRGLGQRMLSHLLARPDMAAVRRLETTVGPDNRASRGMFASLAARLGATVSERAMFEADLFGPGSHEDERLLQIEPITLTNNRMYSHEH